jgi:hypothetical protein
MRGWNGVLPTLHGCGRCRLAENVTRLGRLSRQDPSRENWLGYCHERASSSLRRSCEAVAHR